MFKLLLFKFFLEKIETQYGLNYTVVEGLYAAQGEELLKNDKGETDMQ